MASGIKRSTWLPEVARTLKIPRSKIYTRLNRAGMNSPYLDEPGALEILKASGLDVAKYLAKKNKPNGHAPLALAAPASEPPPPLPTQALAVVPKPHQTAWDRKLIPRLARLLPEGNTPRGKTRAKNILIARGLHGPYKEDMETQAVEIFRAAGVDISNFEWAALEHMPGGGPQQQLRLYTPPPQGPTAAQLADAKFLAAARRALEMLEQFEHHYFKEIKEDYIREMHPSIDQAFAALAELRIGARRERKRVGVDAS